MNRRTRVSLAACICTLILTISALGNSAIYNQLASRSDFIVAGEVKDSTSYWDADGRFILTDYTVRITETLSGDSSENTVVVTVKGGEVGDIGLKVSHEAELETGTTVLLFLHQASDGSIRVTSGEFGAEKIIAGHLTRSGMSVTRLRESLRVSDTSEKGE